MVKKTVEGTIETAYKKAISSYTGADGQPLTPIAYKDEVDQYETVEEAKSKNDWLKDEEILSVVNARAVAAKRQELIKGALDAAGIKAPTLEDSDVAVSAMAKVLLARKKAATQEEAIAQAKEILGL